MASRPRLARLLAAAAFGLSSVGCAEGPVDLPGSDALSGELGVPTIRHEFDAWDPKAWEAGAHPLGRGWFRPGNVTVSGGMLRLGLPAGTFDGGEVRSASRPRGGTYEARIKAAAAPGSLTAFFLYEYTATNIDEIDVEIFGDGSGRVLLATWLRSRKTNVAEVRLPFDPTAGFHVYRIEVGQDRVAFYADGALIGSFTRGLPKAAMHVMVNAWYPTWLAAEPPATDRAALIDWIRW